MIDARALKSLRRAYPTGVVVQQLPTNYLGVTSARSWSGDKRHRRQLRRRQMAIASKILVGIFVAFFFGYGLLAFLSR